MGEVIEHEDEGLNERGRKTKRQRIDTCHFRTVSWLVAGSELSELLQSWKGTRIESYQLIRIGKIHSKSTEGQRTQENSGKKRIAQNGNEKSA